MRLPKLPPLYNRPEDKPDYTPEIWQPNWNCFCCQDHGVVHPNLARLVIHGYDTKQHRLIECQRLGCGIIHNKLPQYVVKHLDNRFNSDLCEQLHQISKEDWRESAKKRQQIKVEHAKMMNTAYATLGTSLRAGKRSQKILNSSADMRRF